MVTKLIDFLNSCDPEELVCALDELHGEVRRIFERKKALIENVIVSEIENRDPTFFVWFCFLHGNFLRGSDVVSNKVFVQFVSRMKPTGYYFNEFPQKARKLLPRFFNPKFRYATQVESVLKQLRRKYSSGRKFVGEIKNIVDSYEIEKAHRLYLELISRFMSFEYIGSKIANAILGEAAWNLNLLRKSKKKIFENFLEEEWIRKLTLVSCFNVMIDIHIRKFFEEKLGIKNVQHFILIFLAKCIKPEVIKALFNRKFGWIPEAEILFENYPEYVGAGSIEKLIWTARFVAKNSRKEDLKNMEFFRMSGDLFL